MAENLNAQTQQNSRLKEKAKEKKKKRKGKNQSGLPLPLLPRLVECNFNILFNLDNMRLCRLQRPHPPK